MGEKTHSASVWVTQKVRSVQEAEVKICAGSRIHLLLQGKEQHDQTAKPGIVPRLLPRKKRWNRLYGIKNKSKKNPKQTNKKSPIKLISSITLSKLSRNRMKRKPAFHLVQERNNLEFWVFFPETTRTKSFRGITCSDQQPELTGHLKS